MDEKKETEKQPASGSIVVELARSGITVVVPPNVSILEAIREAGIEVSSSCELGTCGACLTEVLEGTPDHFDNVLTPEERAEGKVMTICCSGSLTEKLVLDI